LPVADLGDYHPEVVLVYPNPGWREVQILSDDGQRVVNGVSNRDLPPRQKTFRSFWLAPGNSH
jgi:hypothetical protein